MGLWKEREVRRDDWICSKCSHYMIKTQSGMHLICINLKCKNKLRVAKQLMDLPVATKLGRHYVLATLSEFAFNEKGWWTLVPHKHKEALNRRPDSGHVVVRVWNQRYKKWQPRTLRPIHPKMVPVPNDVSS